MTRYDDTISGIGYMGITYFNGKRWDEISREERFFCAELYQHIKVDPSAFARWLCTATRPQGLPLQAPEGWEAGFEVCFYRDFLQSLGRSARVEEYSTKRTFDLCLFAENEMVILEAKVQQGFDATQCEVFRRDAAALRKVIGRDDLKIHLIAVGCADYFENDAHYGSGRTMEGFDGSITWDQLHQLYKDPLFARANCLYRQ